MKKNLINSLFAMTRITLARCRALAMTGNLESALEELSIAREHLQDNINFPATDAEMNFNRMAISLLKAELLHLDIENEKALSIIQTDILSNLGNLPNEIELIIDQNKSEIEISLIKPESIQNLNLSYDEKELIELSFWNPKEVVYAYEYAAEGKHYESLPAFWNELDATYKSGNWSAHRQAARRMSIESLQIGWYEQAVYQAVIAQDKELIITISKHLLALQNSDQISNIVKKLLNNSNLKIHSNLASIFLKEISDAIPDNLINDVFEWLMKRSQFVPTNWLNEPVCVSAWKALISISRRLSKAQSSKVIEIATNHPFWKEPNRLRKHLLRITNALIPNLDEESLEEIAKKSLPAAIAKKDQYDFADALNLLSHISHYSEEAKIIIGDALYNTSKIQSFELQQLAKNFGRTIPPEDANKMAVEIANDIRLQVQRSSRGEIAKPIASFGTSSIGGGANDEKISVSMYSFSAVEALLEYRDVLDSKSIELLVDSILDMIGEDENSPSNKMGLLKRLIKLADSITLELAKTIFDRLLPFAEGKRMELSKIMKGFGDPNNPLNPHKLRMQTPEEVRGASLFTLATIEENIPGVYGDRLLSVIELAMSDPHPVVRKYAFISIRKIDINQRISLTNLLMGTRDPDFEVARMSYLAIAENKYLQFSDAMWQSLAGSLSFDANSNSSIIRRDAAYIIPKRESEWKDTKIAKQMTELKDRFSNDICYSVRATVLQNNSGKED